ncbi:MAG: polysaccharide pyruvyl transferase family protein [Maritimibacter sp.]|nr:polysaccharide pyruvyl transferase family protein [Maritimibacter sp.]
MTPAKIIRAARTLLSNPLFINAYVETVDGRVRPVNWGDDINDHFIRLLSGREIAVYFDTPVAMALKRPNYLCIGSTLNYLTTPQTVVWGAGVIDDTLEMRARPARVTAVRGPLTRDYLLARGIDCPEVYGDPALLLPYFYKPASALPRAGGRIGIVPHYKDQGSPTFAALRQAHPELDFIDIASYGTWTDFIDRISACDAVFSSSLHGLIVAEAYGIRNHWVSVSGNVLGNGFKFRDFFASLGKTTAGPTEIDMGFDPKAFLASRTWSPGRIDLKKLLAACPFEIVEPIRHEHPLDL